jgi:hypothetical protein
MNTRERLESLLAGGGDPLASFGFEFRRTYGRLMPAGCCRYDDVVQLAGTGFVRYTNYASVTNPRGETGVWQARTSNREALLDLVRKIVDAKLDKALAAHVEPADLMLWIRIAVAGTVETFLFSGDRQAHTDLLAPIRLAYGPLVDEAKRNAVRTLGLELRMPNRLPRGRVRAMAQFTFHNNGQAAHWFRNPYSPLRRDLDPGDVRELVYRIVPPWTQDGPAPLPSEKQVAVLLRDDTGGSNEEDYLLLEPGTLRTFEFKVALDLTKSGRYRFDGFYGAFASSEPIDGQPRWAGCTMSNPVELEIA